MSINNGTARCEQWQYVCAIQAIPESAGVAALVAGTQLAIFRVGERVYALDNYDPFSGANVISRGIVGDRAGTPKVASPVYKQSFSLENGACLDDEAVQLRVWAVRTVNGAVEVFA